MVGFMVVNGGVVYCGFLFAWSSMILSAPPLTALSTMRAVRLISMTSRAMTKAIFPRIWKSRKRVIMERTEKRRLRAPLICMQRMRVRRRLRFLIWAKRMSSWSPSCHSLWRRRTSDDRARNRLV